jgi:hypothetical protein
MAAGHDYQSLKKAVCENKTEAIFSAAYFFPFMEEIADRYTYADKVMRRYLLSIISQILPYTEVKKFISGLTYHYYTESLCELPKTLPELQDFMKHPPPKCDPNFMRKVEAFVEFISR